MRVRTPLWLVTLAFTVAVGCGSSDDDGARGSSGGGQGDGNGSGGGQGGNPSGGGGPTPIGNAPDPGGPAPALTPTVLASTYVGGAGNQYLRDVVFEGGRVVARGEGFSISYALDGSDGKIDGNPATADAKAYDEKPPLPGDPGRAYADANGLTLRVGYRQAGANLQQPIFRAFQGTSNERLWSLWGHAADDVTSKNLGADSRCYQAWSMPGGNVGVQCWTDGGNSVLAKDPRNLDSPGFDPAWAKGAYQKSAGGMSSAYVLVDPRDGGRAVSGTFVASHVARLVADPWGRVYVARVGGSRSGGAGPTNPFGQDDSASSGLMVLGPTLQDVVYHVRLGGNCAGEITKQTFGAIALEGGKLALAGTTCATNVVTKNAVQAANGGGQDGFFVLSQLW